MRRWTSENTKGRPSRIARRIAFFTSGASLFWLAQPAFAQCVPDSAGTTVTCSGTSTGYQNGASGVTLNTASGATIGGQVILGSSGTANNAGTITAAAGGATVQLGSNSNLNNTGSLTSTGSTVGSAAASFGDYSTLTNSGTLTAVTGTPVAQFGRGGTFINLAAAPATVNGNVQFGVNLGSDVATFKNYNVAHGFAGSVVSSGNTSIYNAGLFTGTIVQTATAGTVTIVNDTGATFSGGIVTGDVTQLTNNGTMTLSSSSQLGTLLTAGTLFTNNGALTIGTNAAPGTLTVNGNFTQTANGTLSVFLAPPGSTTPVAGSSFGQVFASGGTATLGGKLAVTPSAGFYPTGSTYNVVLADKGITGNFSSVTGNTLTFISFVPNGVITLSSGQQAYQLVVQRTQTYAAALASVATPNQLAAATAFQPLVATASADPTQAVAGLVGAVDFLTVAQAQTFFDNLSPAGYLAYANAMRDQTNSFQRQIALRMRDQNSEHPEQGFWLEGGDQISPGGLSGMKTRESGPALAGGYDFSGPRFVLGAAVGYSYDSLKYAPGNLKGHNSATQFGVYGGLNLGPLTAQGIVSYQFGHIGATRVMNVGDTPLSAKASSSDHLLSVTGTVGPNLKLGGFSFMPFGGVQYSTGSINGFTETQASAADLTVQRLKANRTDLLVGATITPNTGTLRPFIKGTYRSVIGSAPSSLVTAYLNDDPTTSFTVQGLGADKHEVDVDAGLNIVIEDQGGFFFGYHGIYRNDVKTHALSAGLRIEFE